MKERRYIKILLLSLLTWWFFEHLLRYIVTTAHLNTIIFSRAVATRKYEIRGYDQQPGRISRTVAKKLRESFQGSRESSG